MKRIVILGYGGRGAIYAKLCKNMKKDFEIVAVIDNSKEKLKSAKRALSLQDNQLFLSLDDLLKKPKTADWIFICTREKDHKEHSIKALKNGYNILLEKPVACSIKDCLEIEKVAKETNLEVAVCHVLRYSPYYDKIKETIDSGVLGKIISIDQVENIAFWHQAHSFVRGDNRKLEGGTPLIIAKCCHDLDIAVYLANSKCKQVSSQGQLNYFKFENAPKGATEYCLDGCKVKDECPYDAEKIYIEPIKHLPKSTIRNMWPQTRLMTDGIVTIPKLYDALKTTNFGRCVFMMDNDVVDHQVTNIIFENEIYSTLTMTAFSGPCYRETRVRGTLGELVCNMGENKIVLYPFGKRKKYIWLNSKLDAHGGGDKLLIESLAKDELRTDISQSVEGHIIGFAAEESRLNNGMPVIIEDIKKKYLD